MILTAASTKACGPGTAKAVPWNYLRSRLSSSSLRLLSLWQSAVTRRVRSLVGSATTLLSGRPSISASSIPRSGDVLAGVIGALVATNYIEILNEGDRLSEVAASAAFIHNSAALLASRYAPISSTQIIKYIPEAIRKIM